MAAMADDVTALPTLSDDDQAALQGWVRDQGLGSDVTDVAPLTGGTQNIVVHLRVDDRPMVLRRPPVHPRPTSDKTMLREIAVLRTLAGTRRAAPGVHRGLRRPQRAGRGLLPDGGGRRLQPGHRGGAVVRRRPRDAAPRRPVLRGEPGAVGQRRMGGQPACGDTQAGILSGPPGSAVPRAAGELPARLLSARVAAGGDRTRRVAGDQPAARRRTRHHARRRASQQRAAAPRPPRAGGVHRLGDVHGGRPTAGPRLDDGVLAERTRHDQRGFRTRRARWAGHPRRTARRLSRGRRASPRRPWTGTWRWPVSSSASSSRAPGRGTSPGRRTAKQGSGCTSRPPSLIGLGTRVAKGDNPFR